MVRLGVNVDHIATVRQARGGFHPDPVEAALVCEQAGAESIVCHLREDRRHIQDEDVRRLRSEIRGRLNLEMSVAPEIVEIAHGIHPDQVTLVPERRRELTTEGGLDIVVLSRRLRGVIETFRTRGIDVSLFIDPVPDQVRAAQACGAGAIELHTGPYARAIEDSAKSRELAALRDAAQLGESLGLKIAAGHGLENHNVREVAQIPEIQEVNIGFSIVSRALSIGLERAVKEMLAQLTAHHAHALDTA